MHSLDMSGAVARNWWMWLIRGIAAILFGVLAFRWPGDTLVVIGILFGAYAFVDGVFAILATIRAAEDASALVATHARRHRRTC